MITYVSTGEVKAGREDTLLVSNAIGSCVVIAACDPVGKVGALAHVMIPGAAPPGTTTGRTRYAADAIEELVNRMTELGAKMDRVEVCLVGGGNVLKREDDSICEANITSVHEILAGKNLKIRAEELRGTERRSIHLDVKKGSIRFTVGDSKEQLLWKAGKEPSKKDGASGRCGT